MKGPGTQPAFGGSASGGPGALPILGVDPQGPAAPLGIAPGSLLLSLNGAAVRDVLEYRFHQAANRVEVRWVDPAGASRVGLVEKGWDEELGLDVEPLRMRACNNKCAFCFAHQNPRGVRRALYFKDDDYRFSFLNGNFATLTNLADADVDRIVAQRLSPLYVSVHATDWALRNRILGNPKAPNVLDQIATFARGRITMHTQVVLCPGINDGLHLDQTVADLARFHPQVATVALVPVGLTQYRDHLPAIKPPDGDYARALLRWADQRRRRFLRALGSRLVFPSDEFYLFAGEPFPAARTYEGTPQLGNGVGMCRRFLDEFVRAARRLPAAVARPRRVSVVTGLLAEPILRPQVLRLNAVGGLRVDLVPVPNRFFGGTVTCAGLLVGKDILQALQACDGLGEEVLLPSLAMKEDEDIFLDDVTLPELAAALGRPVRKVAAGGRALVAAALGTGAGAGGAGTQSARGGRASAVPLGAPRLGGGGTLC